MMNDVGTGLLGDVKMFGRRVMVAGALGTLLLCASVALGAKTKAYVPGAWKGVRWAPLTAGLKDMEKAKVVGVVFFHNPKDRTACFAWEKGVFERVKDDLKKLEGDVVYIRLNSAVRDGIPESKKLKKGWKKWCLRKKKPRTYVRVLYFDGRRSYKSLSKPPSSPSSFVRTLKRAIKKNEKYIKALAKKEAHGRKKDKTGAGDGEEAGDDSEAADGEEKSGKSKKSGKKSRK